MPILKLNIKRLLKDKFNLFLMIVLPSLAISLSTFFTANTDSNYTIGIIVDEQKSKTVEIIESELRKHFDVKTFYSNKPVVSQMIHKNVECAIVLTNKEVEDIIKQKSFNIKVYSFGKSEVLAILKEYLNSILKILIFKNASNKTESLNSVKNILNSSPTVISKILATERKSASVGFASGFFVMSLLWLALNASNIILKNWHERVIVRILCSPVSKKSYIVQSILGILSILLLQIVFFVMLCIYVFKINLGTNLFIIVLVLLICSFMFVSFALMVISIFNDLKKLSTLNSMIVPIMCMVGGCYWPLEIMPGFLQKIALLFPTTYAANLTKNMLTGKSFESMLFEITAVAAFSLFFTLVSIKLFSKNVMSKV